ncbi:hypothetical protein [Tianweitania sediminis]|uniref:Uncharacterized protein n=1 Tax=Tianweitania sediminis TaxID=1502156 RepID=A0A8J7R4A7_9HYPH|nr:hypothetical protein [Tianweitania sediminis]MBP0439615.1 hypothetical protein [Tianweitania sediminis]
MIDDPDCDGALRCTCCGGWIRKGHLYFRESEGALCEPCAPIFKQLLDEDDSFTNADGDPLSAEERRAWFDGHIAAGGQPTDSMARKVW